MSMPISSSSPTPTTSLPVTGESRPSYSFFAGWIGKLTETHSPSSLTPQRVEEVSIAQGKLESVRQELSATKKELVVTQEELEDTRAVLKAERFVHLRNVVLAGILTGLLGFILGVESSSKK